jgi:hypothetical protein
MSACTTISMFPASALTRDNRPPKTLKTTIKSSGWGAKHGSCMMTVYNSYMAAAVTFFCPTPSWTSYVYGTVHTLRNNASRDVSGTHLSTIVKYYTKYTTTTPLIMNCNHYTNSNHMSNNSEATFAYVCQYFAQMHVRLI